MSELEVVFQDIIAQLGRDFPQLMEVMDQAKSGELGEEQAMQLMLGILNEYPDLQARFDALVGEATELLREEGSTELALPEEPGKGSMVFDSGVGGPRLNPLYEAALLERAQFDGDIPELRTGPLPEEAKPAVPVSTKARNPVALGYMLEEASEEVGAEVRESRRQLAAEVESLAGDAGTLVVKRGTDLVDKARGSSETDPKSYRRGELPALIKVDRPSGGKLSVLSPEESKQLAWKFLSSTQGRRSATETIAQMVGDSLRDGGYGVKREAVPPGMKVLAHASWEVSLGGPRSTQAAFSVIDVAAKALVISLTEQVEKRDALWLEVIPINTVDVRSVGWAARLVG